MNNNTVKVRQVAPVVPPADPVQSAQAAPSLVRTPTQQPTASAAQPAHVQPVESTSPLTPTERPLVTILTATRNRPEAFELLETWMGMQTYIQEQMGPLEWIVVNDGRWHYPNHIPLSEFPLCSVQKIGRTHDSMSGHSMCGNLLAAMDAAHGEIFIIAEDDDYLAPEYIERLVRALNEPYNGDETVQLAGSAPALYYNLYLRKYRDILNETHCSLGQTGFRSSVLPLMREICNRGNPLVDLALWAEYDGPKEVYPTDNLHVSMKGLPGEPGIGAGHGAWRGFTRDTPKFDKLYEWIGDDADLYRDLYNRMLFRNGIQYWVADQEYCYNKDETKIVSSKHQDAHHLLVAAGVELPLADAQRLGVVSPENWAPPKRQPQQFEPVKEQIELEMRHQFAARPSVINTIERGPIDLRTGLPPGQIAPLPEPDTDS